MRDALDLDATLEDFISPGSEWIEIGNQRKHVKSYLADFLFSPARAHSPVRSLSGGERNRLLLARLFARPANVLVLDEPTNDLDIDTLELLEDLLQNYDGTVFLVSHDRTFLDNVVTSTIAFEGDGRWREYEGGVQDWLTQSQARARDRRATRRRAGRPRPRPPPPAPARPPRRGTGAQEAQLQGTARTRDPARADRRARRRAEAHHRNARAGRRRDLRQRGLARGRAGRAPRADRRRAAGRAGTLGRTRTPRARASHGAFVRRAAGAAALYRRRVQTSVGLHDIHSTPCARAALAPLGAALVLGLLVLPPARNCRRTWSGRSPTALPSPAGTPLAALVQQRREAGRRATNRASCCSTARRPPTAAGSRWPRARRRPSTCSTTPSMPTPAPPGCSAPCAKPRGAACACASCSTTSTAPAAMRW